MRSIPLILFSPSILITISTHRQSSHFSACAAGVIKDCCYVCKESSVLYASSFSSAKHKSARGLTKDEEISSPKEIATGRASGQLQVSKTRSGEHFP